MDLLVNLFAQRTVVSILSGLGASLIAYVLIKIPRRIFINRPKLAPSPDILTQPPADDPTAVKVMVLGFEGSGKTMMLAGMYHRWAYGDQHGVVLKADETTAPFLERMISRINSQTGGLPRSTREGDITKATFTFMVDLAGGDTHRSFSLHYMDYAGERIRGALSPTEGWRDPEVMADLAAADILVGVLDGGQIALAMRGEPPSEFANTLAALLIYLANAKQKTTHVVISKWDLVVDANSNGYSLAEVIEFLDRHRPFHQYHQRSPVAGIRRIIPISAFGLNGFVRVDDNGGVHKANSVSWQPFMAENAIACSVPDVIQTHLERTIAGYETAEKIDGRLPVSSLAPLLKVVLIALNSVTEPLNFFDAKGFSYEDLVAAWRTLRDPRSKSPTSKSGAPGGNLPKPEAIIRVLRLFADSVRELEDIFPESEIGRYWPQRNRPRA